jgi:enoyl-CoA hydratase
VRILISRVTDGKITLQETGKIAMITINRPEKRNALTEEMWAELGRLAKIIENNPKNRVVIIKGVSGQFTAGSDISEFVNMSPQEANQAFDKMEEAVSAVEKISIPVIALVDGPAMGAGFVLSLACDIRIGTPNTKMGIPVGRLGITLGPAFVRRIQRLIGPSRTKEMVFTNKIYNYKEAQRLGLLNICLEDPHDLNHYGLCYANMISKQSLDSMKAVKQAVELSEWKQEMPWKYVNSDDFFEGTLAFTQKRSPRFCRKH